MTSFVSRRQLWSSLVPMAAGFFFVVGFGGHLCGTEAMRIFRPFVVNAPSLDFFDFGSSSLLRRFLVDTKARDQMFRVYWNAPTFQCRSHGVPFDGLRERYGVRQNERDSFRGDQIAILYDPGKFPALLEDPNGGGKAHRRNGGVPQEGDLDEHLAVFKRHLGELLPDETFNGLAIIDFESWRPIFRQNWGSLQPYKDLSYEIERERHPFWSKKSIEKEAVRRFEEAGRKFMESTLKLAKQERPLAKWGYYAFPYCFNNKGEDYCSDAVMKENDRIQWLWNESDYLYPSLYLDDQLDERQRLNLVKGRMAEAKRVSSRTKGNPPIVPYTWYKYRNDEFVTKEDIYNGLDHLKKSGAAGAIIWGSSNDVNTKDKCLKLKDYVENVLGPVVSEFTPKGKSSEGIQSSTEKTTVTTTEKVEEEPEEIGEETAK